MKITELHAYEILASGGYPTIEAKVTLEDGSVGVASVPYGASAGSHEATVLIDGDKNRWGGKGMLQAAENINYKLSSIVVGLDAYDQRGVDEEMMRADGTENKSVYGGNAILAVSLAVARAAAQSKKIPLYRYVIDTFETGVELKTLPQPMVVVIEGGKHAHESTDLQEFCFTAVGEKSVKENLRAVMESYHHLKNVLEEDGLSTNVGNEGAFAPNGIASNEKPFEYMLEAIKRAGYEAGSDISISIDAAASEFYEDGKYNLKVENRILSADELMRYYQSWMEKYPIVTIEDMLDEDAWDDWVKLNTMAKDKGIELIGDDLTVTNVKRLQKAIDMGAISAILIKLNQIGTLTETVDCCMLARKHNLMTTTSHRGGGESNDAVMIDVAVAVGSRFVKVGPTRGERVAKYNRLMEIEREVGIK